MDQSSKHLPGYSSLLSACSVAIASLVPIALYQCGVLPALPDPPGRYFGSEAITRSPAAHPLGIPDALLGVASYGVTLALILKAPRSLRVQTWLAAKLACDGGVAAFNLVRQVVTFRRICSWCMITAGATAVLVYKGRRVISDATAEAIDAIEHYPEPEPVLDALSPAG